MRRFALVIIGAACFAMPALADEVGVRVGPVGATVGTGPDRVVHEREVIREREPVEKKVIIKREREREPATVIEKKTIIHD